ncbi:uncharacterized protein E6C27_scaffold1186G00160 [Cucumis melo var. makuwa]|uniref:Gag protease polyprotein n=1 Tax=Cucumis melo var. makuwa TaxID=1194695 RepID=A0A5A7UT09_CUCMM|nr:uncharacterized protein E6C27_scaffold1186G00160 [Cucumis melo var. makuwa]
MDIDMIRVIRRDPRTPIVIVFLRVGAEVRVRASWRATRSDHAMRSIVTRQEKMPPRRGSRRRGGRRGREAGRTQPEEQHAVQAANPNAPDTQADLAAIEQRYQDMLQAALDPFLVAQQT